MGSMQTEAILPQFYSGRDIFITGGTGFLGKMLISRLLSTCPDIGRVHVLIRDKHGQTAEERLAVLKRNQVFAAVRSRSPAQLAKLCAVRSDGSSSLDLTEEALAALGKVSVVFHGAATVKFHEQLRRATQHNVRLTVSVMKMCDRLPRVQSLVYVSTAYSNAELPHVCELVYQPPATLQQLLTYLHETTDEELTRNAEQYMHPKPNTYTFTKAVSEHAVQQHGAAAYGVAIFRPTIVVSSNRDPAPGWIDSLNGPGGVIAGVGSGLLRVMRSDVQALADLMPVDLAADTLLAVAWETCVERKREVRVYNCSSGAAAPTWERFQQVINTCLRERPFSQAVWHPHVVSVTNRYTHAAMEFALQTLPHHAIGYISRLVGIKTDILSSSAKLQQMSAALSYFSLRQWTFSCDNVQRVKHKLTDRDREIYQLDPNDIDWSEHITNFVMGIRKYVLKEEEDNLKLARRRMNRFLFLHNTARLMLLYYALKLLLKRNVFSIINILHKIIP